VVLQTINVTLTNVSSTTSSSYANIGGLTVNITPYFSTSNVLVTVHLYGNNNTAGESVLFQLYRGTTNIGGGTAASNRLSGFSSIICGNVAGAYFSGGTALDSPASTSATTYYLQYRVTGGKGNVGSTGDDNDTANRLRYATSIIVSEIAA
jgi:hypothetical protein